MTGSNSEASARSARSSSSAAAAAGIPAGAGQDAAQVLDQVRAGPRALFLLGQRDRLLRRAGQLELGEHRAFRAARARARAAALAVPDRRRDRRQRHAEGARELVRPARVRLREIQRAVLGVARVEVRRLREVRELALGRRAAVPLLEPRRAAAQVRGDRRAAGGEHAHHLAADALDLEAVAVVARGPFQAEPGGEGFFQVLGDDRGDRADVLVVAQGVRGPPFPVGARPGGVGDLGVDVQLHVAVPGGVLQPVRHRQVRFVPLAGLPAVHPGAVGAGAGVAGLALEVAEPGVHGLPDHLVDLADQGGPVRIAVVVAGLAGQAGVLPEGGVEDRDALGQRQRQVEEQRALPGLPDGLGPQLALAFGGGVRLGGQQLRVQVGGFAAAVRRPAQPGCHQEPYARRTADRTVRARPSGRARSQGPWRPGPTTGPAALRRSRWPGCSSWPRPWPGRGPPASRCSQGHSPCSASRQLPLSPAPPRRGRSRTDHDHLMMHGCDALKPIMHQGWQNGRSRSETRNRQKVYIRQGGLLCY